MPAFTPTGAHNTTTNAEFIPELWSDDVIAAYKRNLIVANLVTKINHVGKKGDTIHIPQPTRGTPSQKVTEDTVTLITENMDITFLVLCDDFVILDCFVHQGQI